MVQITKAVRALMNDLKEGLKDIEPADEMKSSEKLDALEVIKGLLVYYIAILVTHKYNTCLYIKGGNSFSCVGFRSC